MKNIFVSESKTLFIACSIALGILVSCNTNSDKIPDNSAAVKTLKNPSIKPKPYMWVDMLTGAKRQNNFYQNEYPTLSKFIGKDETDSIFFPITSFKNLCAFFDTILNYKFLRVYIANYGKAGSGSVPPGYENKLAILLVPVDSNGIEKGYYTIPDNEDQYYKLDSTIATNWISNYTTGKIFKRSKMDILRAGINKGDIENHEGGNLSNPYSDTKSIKYTASNIQELIDEVSYQGSENNNKVSGLRVFFTAFGREGKEQGNEKGMYKKRIFIQFEFTKLNIHNENEVFYIDTTHSILTPGFGFMNRPDQQNTQKMIGGVKYNLVSFDNGLLCPANCPPR